MKIINSKDQLMKKILLQIKSITITILVFIFVTSILIEGSIVPTPSMESTILTGDRLLINKFIFGPSTPTHLPFTNIELPHFRFPSIREPERGEILVFRYPGDITQLKDDKIEFWVKRCVALPGDTLEIRNKVVYVNGERSAIPPNINYFIQPIKKKGIKTNNIFPATSSWNEDNYGPLIIPKKDDNISLSPENIDLWETLINRELNREAVSIEKGRVLIDNSIVSNYSVQNDYYFMVGDNRDNSLDSRFWGFLSRENIVGKPLIIFWSWDSDIPFTRPLDLMSSIRFNRIAKLVK